MIRGLYTAASALIANLRRQESVANNIANVSTPGYRGEVGAQGAFSSVLVRSIANAPLPVPLSLQHTLGAVGTGTFVAQRGSYLADGPLRSTDEPLDLALRGPGFFVLDGPSGALYTRGGHFTRDSAGFLATTDGMRVLDVDGQPIALPDATALDTLEFAATGEMLVDDEVLAVLQIVDIPSSALVRAGDTAFAATGGVTAAAGATLLQGALEQSNIDINRAATQLLAASQQFGANQRVFLTLNESLERAVREVGRLE